MPSVHQGLSSHALRKKNGGRSHQYLPGLTLCCLPMGTEQPLPATLEATLCFLSANSEEPQLHIASALLFSIQRQVFYRREILLLTALGYLQENIC